MLLVCFPGRESPRAGGKSIEKADQIKLPVLWNLWTWNDGYSDCLPNVECGDRYFNPLAGKDRGGDGFC